MDCSVKWGTYCVRLINFWNKLLYIVKNNNNFELVNWFFFCKPYTYHYPQSRIWEDICPYHFIMMIILSIKKWVPWTSVSTTSKMNLISGWKAVVSHCPLWLKFELLLPLKTHQWWCWLAVCEFKLLCSLCGSVL